MRELIVEFFRDYNRIVIFLHVISAVLLVGSLFFIRFFLSPVLDKIEDEKIRYGSYLNFFNCYFYFIIIIMTTIITVSVLMNVGLSFKYGDPTTYIIIHTKEAIWTFIVLNFIFIYLKYKNAKVAFKKDLMIEVHENMVLIVKYLIPLELFLGVVAIYFGIIVRGW